MADAVMEPRPIVRYFCHRCNIEFEDVLQLQDYTCPYCAGGFIEQMGTSEESVSLTGEDFSDADMSNLDDSDDMPMSPPDMLNAIFMSGGRLRGNQAGGGGGGGGGGGVGGGGGSEQGAEGAAGAEGGRRTTLMDELVWMIGGARPTIGAVAAGTPFVFVGAPGDYVFGGEGLDAVVSQLLGQLENTGPPPMPGERLAALPDEPVGEECAAAGTACSICWDNFALGETICRLECEHIFHSTCIRTWLHLHATCPICRRSLLPDPPEPAPAAAPTAPTAAAAAAAAATPAFISVTNAASAGESPAAALRTSIAAAMPRILLRRIVHAPAYRARDSSGSGSSAARAAWPPRTDSSASSTSSASIMSDIERHYNLDLDMD